MPHDVKILTETDLRELVKLDLEAVNVVERAFLALGSGDVIMPPIMSMTIPQANGEVDVKTAYIPGLRQLRHQGQPRLLRQSQDRPAEP
jgi:ornithine cyclodeaminase/alanine dehydrogenase-like protein (mu-crystallin family)